MYKHQEMENRVEKEIALFFISCKSPIIGAFILFNSLKKIICYR